MSRMNYCPQRLCKVTAFSSGISTTPYLLHDSTYIVDPWWYKWFVALPRSSQVRRKWCCSPIQQGTFRQSPGDCSSSSTRKSWRRMLCPRGQNWTAACHEKGHGPGDRRMHGSFTQFFVLKTHLWYARESFPMTRQIWLENIRVIDHDWAVNAFDHSV